MRITTRLLVAAVALTIAPLVGSASAAAHLWPAKPKPKPDPVCVIHSNPSMVEAGLGTAAESSLADIIQVECRPIYSQNTVTIDATQLSNACHGTLSWATPPAAPSATGAQFTVTLDNEGNAIAVVWGGPSCAPSKDRISASLNAPPFVTPATTFVAIPPGNTRPGVTANPASEVEDSVFSSVATVIQVEFPSVQAEKSVTIKSDELNTRCAATLSWFGPEETALTTGAETTVQLDDNGNAFVVAIAGPSCASGLSTITADLTTAPYTTEVGHFTVQSPRSTV
jgi:hypothetical protein